MKSAFAPFDRRLRLIDMQIKPAFAALRAEAGSSPVPYDRLVAPFTG